MNLDISHVAVLHTKGDPSASSVSLGRNVNSFFKQDSIKAHPIKGWYVAESDAKKVSKLLPEETESVYEQQVQEAAITSGEDLISPVFLDDSGEPLIITDTILVRFGSDVSHLEAKAILQKAAAGTVLEADWAGMKGTYRVQCGTRSGFSVLRIANELAERDDVIYAEPSMIFSGKGRFTPNDPLYSQQWALNNTGQSGGTSNADMDAPEAWDTTIGDPNIKVVVLDTGVQQNHPDINQVPGADFTDEGGDGGPHGQYDNHGTAVAGCISASINNATGVSGVAPGCRVASARVFKAFNSNGNWNTLPEWTVNALAWAQSIGARVTNNSNEYGSNNQSAAIASKYADTQAAGIVHFAASGNGSANFLVYPASLPYVNSVGSLMRNGTRYTTSNYGVGLDFSAPGHQVLGTDRTGSAGYDVGDYVSLTGTSFASPYAAGVAALALSVNSSLNADQVEKVLQDSCVDLGAAGYDTTYGYGFVNAKRAVKRATVGAQFVDQTVPTSVPRGQAFTAWVRVTNTGTKRWKTEVPCDLGSQNPKDNTVWGTNRIGLRSGRTYIPYIGPGDTINIEVYVTAPSQPGNYNFQWRMITYPDNIGFGDTTPNAVINVY